VRVDVFFGASSVAPAELQGRVVVVIDVLRASTTLAVALSHGARCVIPFESADEAITRARSFERSDVLLAGERKMVQIPGFDLGNSPRDFTRQAVEGKTILFTTTNGTSALLAAQGAKEVVVGSYVNFSAVMTMLTDTSSENGGVALLCAGRERHFSLEDAACAGRFVRALDTDGADAQMNDAAAAALMIEKRYGDNISAMLLEAEHGRALAGAGFDGDLEICAQLDAYPVIPVYAERQITRLAPERER
jgi:2-phosphosulfolactate phosphatase